MTRYVLCLVAAGFSVVLQGCPLQRAPEERGETGPRNISQEELCSWLGTAPLAVMKESLGLGEPTLTREVQAELAEGKRGLIRRMEFPGIDLDFYNDKLIRLSPTPYVDSEDPGYGKYYLMGLNSGENPSGIDEVKKVLGEPPSGGLTGGALEYRDICGEGKGEMKIFITKEDDTGKEIINWMRVSVAPQD